MLYAITIDGKDYRLEVNRLGGSWQCLLDGRQLQADAIQVAGNALSLLIDGVSFEARYERTASNLYLWLGGKRFAVEVRDPRSLRGRKSKSDADDGPRKLMAAMTGKVVRVLARERDEVQAGQGVLVVEAMKMQNEIKSPKKGVLQKLLVAPGASVNTGDLLAIIE